VQRIDAGAPALVGKRRIGDHVIEGLQRFAVLELRIGQGVALHDQRAGVVVQDHVHARQAAGGGVLLLPVERDFRGGLGAHFQQQRSRAAGRVVHGGRCSWSRPDADDLAMMRLTSAGV
jgi:hypothetical protein